MPTSSQLLSPPPSTGHKRSRSSGRSVEEELLPRSKILRSALSTRTSSATASMYPQRPKLAVFDHRFSQAEDSVIRAVDSIASAYEQMQADDIVYPEIEGAVEDVRSIAAFRTRYPPRRPVVALGAAAAGKSSSINTTTAERGIAAVSSSDRGTHTLVTYESAGKAQPDKFAVVCQFMTREEIATVISSHLDIIFKRLEHDHEENEGGRDGDDDESDEDDDSDESDDGQETNEVTTAYNFFLTILRGTTNFDTVQTISNHFICYNSRAELASTLTDMIEGFKDNQNVSPDGTKSFTASDHKQLGEIFTSVCRPSDAPPGQLASPHPAPIVKQVRVYLQNDLLDAGVVIADSPGVTDTNTDVVEVAIKALESSGAVLLFAPFQRARGNAELDRQLKLCCKAGRMYDTHLVLTKVDVAKVPDDFDRLSHDPRQVQSLQNAETALARLHERKRHVLSQQDQALKRGDSEEVMHLVQQNLDLDAMVADGEGEVRSISTKMFVDKVKIDLRSKLRDVTRSPHAPDLPVHCVSNSRYQTLLDQVENDGDGDQCNRRDLIATGIPELRNVLYGTAGHGKLDLLDTVLHHELPSTLDSLIGIINRSQISHKEETGERLAKIYDGSGDVIQNQADHLKHALDNAVSKKISEKKRAWTRKATKQLGTYAPVARRKEGATSTGWAALAARTFLAFCKYNGRFNPYGGFYTSWNEVLCNIVADPMNAMFEDMETETRQAGQGMVAHTEEVFDMLLQGFEDSNALGAAPTAHLFCTYLTSERQRIIRIVSKLYGIPYTPPNNASASSPPKADIPKRSSLIARLRSIRDDATVHAESGYLVAALKPTYAACVVIRTPLIETITRTLSRGARKKQVRISMHEQRLERVEAAFRGEKGVTYVFNDVGELVKAAWEKEVDSWARKLGSELEQSLSKMQQEFTQRFGEEGEVSGVSVEARRRLREAVERALEEVREGQRLVGELREMERETTGERGHDHDE